MWGIGKRPLKVIDKASSVKFGSSKPATYTLSVGSTTAPSSPFDYLSESHLLVDGKEDAATQGGWHYDTAGGIRQFPSVNRTANGNITTTLHGYVWSTSFIVSGDFAIRVDGADALLPLYEIFIDGVRYVGENTTGVNGGRRWLSFSCGSGLHYIKVRGREGVKWYGYTVKKGAIAKKWTPTRTTIIFGDSFTAGTGADVNVNGFGLIAKLSENHNVILSGLGGSGYVNAGDGVALSNRIIADYNSIIAANGVPDEVIIAMGVNDLGQAGIEAAANTAFNNLRTVYPGQVYVFSPFDLSAPSAPTANFTTAKTAILNAVNARAKFNFIDFEGVAFTKSDAVHPDTAGHKVLGDYLKSFLGKSFETNVEDVLLANFNRGVSGTFASPTSITVKNGIITAIS